MNSNQIDATPRQTQAAFGSVLNCQPGRRSSRPVEDKVIGRDEETDYQKTARFLKEEQQRMKELGRKFQQPGYDGQRKRKRNRRKRQANNNQD